MAVSRPKTTENPEEIAPDTQGEKFNDALGNCAMVKVFRVTRDDSNRIVREWLGDHDPDGFCESVIKAHYGGGRFYCRALDESSKYMSQHTYTVAGAPKSEPVTTTPMEAVASAQSNDVAAKIDTLIQLVGDMDKRIDALEKRAAPQGNSGNTLAMIASFGSMLTPLIVELIKGMNAGRITAKDLIGIVGNRDQTPIGELIGAVADLKGLTTAPAGEAASDPGFNAEQLAQLMQLGKAFFAKGDANGATA